MKRREKSLSVIDIRIISGRTPPDGWNGEPLMADGTYADPDKYGVIAIDVASEYG